MPISTHILDTSQGRPAAAVPVSLARLESGHWTQLGAGNTDADGRFKDLLPAPAHLATGIYRIRFEIAVYFDRIGIEALYPYIEIAFRVAPGQSHYHIPLLLTAYGYSTYRGS